LSALVHADEYCTGNVNDDPFKLQDLHLDCDWTTLEMNGVDNCKRGKWPSHLPETGSRCPLPVLHYIGVDASNAHALLTGFD
jgi:hypothetical protein